LVRHGLEERHARNRHARRRSRDSLAKLKTEITDLIREAQKSVPDADDLDDELRDAIDVAAELCAHGRTAVPRSSHGSRDINGVVETEESFRLVGQLTTLARCLFALGMDDAAVLELVRRAAWDSMPQIRRDVLVTVRDADGLNTNEIAGRVAHDWKTVKRALDDLELIGGGMVERTESGRSPKDVPIYRWSITPAFEGIVAGQPSDLTLKEHPLSPQLVSTSRVSSDGGSASTHTSRDASPAGLLSETTARGRESG
jgi:hypothetical protein